MKLSSENKERIICITVLIELTAICIISYIYFFEEIGSFLLLLWLCFWVSSFVAGFILTLWGLLLQKEYMKKVLSATLPLILIAGSLLIATNIYSHTWIPTANLLMLNLTVMSFTIYIWRTIA